jgi:hypothetical protein
MPDPRTIRLEADGLSVIHQFTLNNRAVPEQLRLLPDDPNLPEVVITGSRAELADLVAHLDDVRTREVTRG